MSYSQRLEGPVCIFNHHKILELKKTQGSSTFQRLSKAGYVGIRIARLCGIDSMGQQRVFFLYKTEGFYSFQS